jgi:hypothetical protein
MEPGAWGYNWGGLSLEDMNTGSRSSRFGVTCKVVDLALKKNVAKSKEVKTG